MLPKVVRLLLLLFFGLLWFGQLQRINISSTIAVYFHEFVLLMVCALVLLTHLSSLKEWILKERDILKLGAIFIGGIMLSLIFHQFLGKQTFLGWLYLFRFLLYLSLWPTLRIACSQRWISKTQVRNGIILFSFGILFSGIFQYFALPDTRFLAQLGWDDHYFRAISTLFDPGFSAGVGILGLLLSTNWLSQSWKKRWVWIIGLIGLLLTYSRAGFLSFLGGFLIWGIRSKKISLIVMIFLFFISGIFLLPRPKSEGARLERTASIDARIRTYQDSLNIENPTDWVVGKGWYLARSNRGLNSGSIRVNPSGPDNPFVHVFESLGLPGIVIFFLLCWKITQRFWKSPQLFACWGSILIGSMFNNLLFYPWILVLIMGMLTVET